MTRLSDADTDTDAMPNRAMPEFPAPPGMSSTVQFDVAAASHQGNVRQLNEDHYLVARFERSMQTMATNLPPDCFRSSSETAYGMVVADGMGGHAAGEIASQEAIRALVELVLHTPDWIMRLNDQLIQQVLKRLEDRIQNVSAMLLAQSAGDPNLRGMGTTMTVACSLGVDMLVAHVGDSRTYLFRDGTLHQLTRDHTYAQALVETGELRPNDAVGHPLRNVLTRAIGMRSGKVRADLDHMRLVDGDQVLLCTDGLTDMVAESAIRDLLARPASTTETCNQLVERALEAGGRDNVTVVLARYRFP